MSTVLVIEDERDIREVLRRYGDIPPAPPTVSTSNGSPREAVTGLGIDAQIEKVTYDGDIAAYGIMSTRTAGR